VPNGEERLKEAAPKKARIGEMEIVAVERLADALHAAWT
jgi:DNA repair protein RadA/Sms